MLGVLPTWASRPQMNPECFVDGCRIGLIEAIIADVASKALNIEKCTPKQLQWLKNVVDHANVVAHPIVKKILEAIKKCRGFSSFNPTRNINVYTAMSLREPITSKLNRHSDIPTHFSQNQMTIEQVSKVIVESGRHLHILELTEVNDQLMGLIAKHCPGVLSLSIVQKPGPIPSDFTDQSLESIAQLEALERLHLSIWSSVKISRPALLKLLGSSHLKQSLKELKLCCYHINDDAMKIISTYEQLEIFNATSATMTVQGVETFSASISIQRTLRSLSLRMGSHWGTLVSDHVLKCLKHCIYLKELTLHGKWYVSEGALQSLLYAHRDMIKLSLIGLPIGSADAARIAQMQELSELYIGDASALSEEDFFKLLSLQHNQFLRILGICRGCNLTLRHFQFLKALPNLQCLSLSNCEWLKHGLKEICDSQNLQTKLRYLEIADNKWITGLNFAEIGKLAALTCLRIINCPQFNNDSLNGLIEGPTRDTLRELELNTIAATMIERLGQLNLCTLMLSNCWSAPKENWAELLKQTRLHEKLQKLHLNFPALQSSMLNLFEAFTELRVLILGNVLGLDNTQQISLLKNKRRVEIFEGDKFDGWSELIGA